jgi:signal transduction histidine kinase
MADEPIRLLLVEDNPADARLLRECIAEAGADQFHVTHAARLAEAVNFLKSDRFDLALLDLSLPDSQSLETVRRIRSEAPHTPIVVLTGLDDESLGTEAVREGAQDYLVKGQVDCRILSRAIKYAIERHLADEALARYRDGLEELVAQRTAALAATNEALQAEISVRVRAEAALESAHRKLTTDRERQRFLLASELHDSIGQELVGLKLTIEQVRAGTKGTLCEAPDRLLSGAVEKCMALIREVRGICYGLYPPALESFGLPPALRQLARDAPAAGTVEFHVPEAVENARFSGEVEIACFRIAQEAVNNAIRHSGASRIDVSLDYTNGILSMSIADNGVGFEMQEVTGKGLGFISMKERAAGAGGRLALISRPGETKLEVLIPTKPRAAAEENSTANP